MTSISALSSSTSTYRMPPPPQRTSGTGQDPMAAVAEKLGLSSNDLKGQLQDGKSLDDIATSQGVAHDDLITAIKAGLPTSSSGVDSTEIAEKIARSNGVPPSSPSSASGPGGPSGSFDPGSFGGPRGENAGIQDSSKLSRISDLLDMDKDEVSTSATSATKLIEMLQNKGVDLGQLRNVLNSGDLIDVTA